MTISERMADQRDRKQAFFAKWRPLIASTPSVRPCYFCAMRFLNQEEPCELDSIRAGTMKQFDGYDWLPICDEHAKEQDEQARTSR